MWKWSVIFLFLPCVLCRTVPPRIIIIGAGSSGISAATRLIENNITDFIFLEAEERLGGRIHSVFMLDGEGGNVDLGAEFVGGEEGNVIYQVAKDHLKPYNYSMKIKYYYSDGTQVNAEVATDVSNYEESLKSAYKNKEPISAAEGFHRKFNETVLKKFANDPTKLKQAMEFVNTCESTFQLIHSPYDWKKLLLNDHGDTPKGNQALNWKGKGFKVLLDILMTKFGDEHRLNLFPIYYSTPVTSIEWGNNEKVQLKTENGQNYEVDHVIFTPSAGVLKAKHKELFKPNLPADKIDAIEKIGYDAVMKMALQYEKRWWPEDVFEFIFVYSKEDEVKLCNEYKVGPQKDGKSWVNSLYRVLAVEGLPNTLMAWITGPLVPEIEKLEDETLKEGFSLVIKKFLGKDYNVTDPKLIVSSKWLKNPSFHGTYSYETVESTKRKKQVHIDLAEPLWNKNNEPVVLFAGEHTHETYYGSVHGAMESGYRAADKIVQHMKKKKV